MDELVHVITHFAQPVKFVPLYGEEEARGVVLFAGIFQVSCLRQDFSALSTGTGKYLNLRQKSSMLNSRTQSKPSPIAIW